MWKISDKGMWGMAKMIGVWMNINNPNRSAQDDLNLTVGGTIVLTQAEVRKLVPGQLFNVRIRVMDEDSFSDDLVYSDNSFSIGVSDTNPKLFHTGVIVPRKQLRDSEPGYENEAEVYCRVSAGSGNISTNWRNSQTENVKI
jgi:hypothetical protein